MKQDVYRALGVEHEDLEQLIHSPSDSPATRTMHSQSRFDGVYRFLGMYDVTISPRYFTSALCKPATLAKCRLAIGLYASLVVLIDIIHTQVTQGLAMWFSYYTHISYVALSAYFLFAGVHTARYAQFGMTRGLPCWPRLLQVLHMVLQHTVCAGAMLVTIVYWAVLAGDMDKSAYPLWVNISMHALNTCFALFEIWFSRVTTRFALMLPSFLVVLLYLPIVYIEHARSNNWVYFFFGSSNKAIVAGSILGIGILGLLCNLIVQLLQALRERVFGAHRGMSEEEAERPSRRLVPQVDPAAIELEDMAA
ncbi:hypothetical protein BCR37DRAFT_391273 [Protomyces lactucae-debilis]|uniref:FAR-17a/AIG1-like protein-domain-containing protein n=1 Tax=Protomyces lactucae-debilis TaxID=2754530 RepID=A0A1Y2FS11_PROLT|nr:uncharacterized protein BCR37DRAFT_391273 [Protomyces lactucae-debilis]ORY85495.1 hypothetical protein BCR37DRAFT_391273 [Protomyces lactucae-debilis]